jgi:hypothetical protein
MGLGGMTKRDGSESAIGEVLIKISKCTQPLQIKKGHKSKVITNHALEKDSV